MCKSAGVVDRLKRFNEALKIEGAFFVLRFALFLLPFLFNKFVDADDE